MPTITALTTITRIPIYLGTIDRQNIFCLVLITEAPDSEGPRISFTGVIGPNRYGDCSGSCGQILDTLEQERHSLRLAPEWTATKLSLFLGLWRRWHLNDTHAECEHQRARGETWKTHPLAECPDCGYKLGTEWKYERIPEQVLDTIQQLPRASKECPWPSMR